MSETIEKPVVPAETVDWLAQSQPVVDPTLDEPVPPLPVIPTIQTRIGKQVRGWFIEVLVEGETMWKAWRATEPTAEEMASVQAEAQGNILEHGVVSHQTASGLGMAKPGAAIVPPEPVSMFHPAETIEPAGTFETYGTTGA